MIIVKGFKLKHGVRLFGIRFSGMQCCCPPPKKKSYYRMVFFETRYDTFWFHIAHKVHFTLLIYQVYHSTKVRK